MENSNTLFNVYLRLRPSSATNRERFLDIEQVSPGYAPTHITIKPPINDNRKRAVEKFAFTRVFEEFAGQRELFESTGALGLVEGVLGQKGREGRDGLLATLGVTGSGKSHTILGSKSQRGITQLTLDVLFNQTSPHLIDLDSSATDFQSLCSADVSEAQLLLAANFLDSVYCPDHYGYSRGATPARGMTPARGATPGLVRESAALGMDIPGAFPSDSTSASVSAAGRGGEGGVFDRLYPSLAKYKYPASRVSYTPSKHKPSFIPQSISKLTSAAQETSFLSTAHTAGSRGRNAPRISSLPTYPPIDDITVNVDTTAEYAIIVSMYEVHNDRIFDLLSSSSATQKSGQKPRRPLLFKSTEMSPDRKVVAGLKKVVCSDLEEALLVLETGLHERRIANTGSNATSSRSHGFFCLEVKKRRRASVPGPWTSSTLTIVDLAGSERARIAKTAGATLAEAGKINESLMYLGQCMQMHSDNSNATTPNLVPFRQCKLTELLFSNSFAPNNHAHHQNHGGGNAKTPQKAIMVVTADPLGDFNSTSQILRYSALAREVTVPRIPSVTSTILSGAAAAPRPGSSGRTTPGILSEELEAALQQISTLRAELEVAQVRFEEETRRRKETEASWQAAELRIEEIETEIREEVWMEMEAKLALEQRRWRAARDEEMEAQEVHLDQKVEILSRGLEDEDKENVVHEGGVGGKRKLQESTAAVQADPVNRVGELEDENAELKARLVGLEERERGLRSPSKKMRVLKTIGNRRWEGSGLGLDEIP